MSYDISLYRPEFLRRAIEQNLGDWSRPDPIPEADVSAIVERLLSKGYVKQFAHPQFGDQYTHPNAGWGIQVSVDPGSIEFTVPYGVDAARAVAAALADARELKQLANLAL